MAVDTPKSYRNLVIYELFVRNHGANGTFADVAADLARLKEMGVDVVWFMPIHPIGEKNRKGSLGSPYSIQNYREINPDYGTKDEFRQLCQYAHALNMKVMIDVVYNHAAHDAAILQKHPNWFHRDENGRSHTTVPEWWDVIDLDYSKSEALWAYQIETLKMWVELGVDGFRCDVASIVPLPFWLQARREVAQLNPEVIWLAESVHTSFIIDRRQRGLLAHGDGEIHQAFDLSYDYDLWPVWERAVSNPSPENVSLYLSLLQYQRGIYPTHAIKMRCVENHDQPRLMARAETREQGLAWTAFMAFNEGAFLIYGGQETEATHTPSLFEEDKVQWEDYRLQNFLTTLCQLKKDRLQKVGQFSLLTAVPAISAVWQTEEEALYGVFNVAGEVDVMPTSLPDGHYPNLLSNIGETFEVRDGEMAVPETAVVTRLPSSIKIKQAAQLFKLL